MVSILIVSLCKYKDYFRFYKVYFHIFIIAVRGWLIHTQHENQSLYTNVRTRTYAHATRQLFDHRPPITHNNLLRTILQRWSKDIQMGNRPPIDHLSISIPAYTFSPFNTILFLLDNNRSIAIYDRAYCSLYLYNVTQHFTKHWKILILNIGKHIYQRLENTFIKGWKTLLSTLENTFIKHWITLLPNVGKHFCQTLENTFVKRWKTLLPNVGKHFCQTLDNT